MRAHKQSSQSASAAIRALSGENIGAQKIPEIIREEICMEKLRWNRSLEHQ
jgi:hypothetical protein